MSEQNYTNYQQEQPYGSQPNPQGTPQQDFDAYGNPIAPDAKTISVLSHLSSVLLYLITVSTLSFAGPLVFWLVYRNKPGYQFTAANSARAFNFNITIWIVNAAAALLTAVTFGIGVVLAVPIWIATTVCIFVFHIIGAVKASHGEVYDYPMQIRVLKN